MPKLILPTLHSRTHDINMDKKLDGLEIYFSLEHAMDHLSEGPGTFNSTEAQERVIGKNRLEIVTLSSCIWPNART